MIAALVGETGWTIDYIQSLTQYQIDELLRAFVRFKTISMSAIAPSVDRPQIETSTLSGGRKKTTTIGMTSIPQILDAVKTVGAQVKKDG